MSDLQTDGTATVEPEPGEGPLAGVLVIDLSRALAGPHASMLLADLGARVIKIESQTGDDSRGWGPPFVQPGPEGSPITAETGESTYFLSCNRNKESVVADLKSEDGRMLLTALLQRADVLVENFRPGVLDRLGFSVACLHELNPRLVLLSISGFGVGGPDGARPGYDQIMQGEAGLMSLTGSAAGGPTKLGVPIADLLAGIHGAYGVLAALYERQQTGLGKVVRTSLLSSVIGVHAFQATRWTVAGEVPGPSGDHHPSICPYGLFHAADAPIQIAVGSESLWKAFAGAFALDRPEWSTNSARVADRDAVIAAIEGVFATRNADGLTADLNALGIPAGKVRSIDQVYEWEQTKAQGLVVEVEHSSLGTLRLPGNPVRFDGGPINGGRSKHLPPPRLGEHTEAVRAWINSV